MDPQSYDSSVLSLQHVHCSHILWDTQVTMTQILHYRQCEAVFHRTMSLDRRIIPYLQQACFYGIARLGFVTLDWHLVTALIKRWRLETQTFHMAHGEMTITLQDVSIILGLPVDGLSLTSQTSQQWHELSQSLL